MTEHERRRYPRLQANALVRSAGMLHAFAERRVNDMSLGGLRVFSDEEHRAGERLEFELLLEGDETVTFVGKVVWTERLVSNAPARFDNGIRYVEISDHALERIGAVLGNAA